MDVVAKEMTVHAADERANYEYPLYIYILFPHGGAVESMDPKNEKTSYGKRDSPGISCCWYSRRAAGNKACWIIILVR